MIPNRIRILGCSSLSILSLVFLLLAVPALAGSSPAEQDGSRSFLPDLEVTGYIENESTFRLNSPSRFSKLQMLMELEFSHDLKDWGELHLLTWVPYNGAYDIYSDDFSEDARDEYGSYFSASDPMDQIFREAYIDLFFESMDVRLGKQQVVWGEATGLRITDVVNPQDFREFILDDFTDSRIPLWMAKFTYYVGNFSLTGLWIPLFEPDRPALAGSEWEWTFNRIDPPEGVGVVVHDADEPDSDMRNSEYGARVSGLVGGWNMTLSYLYAWEDMPARHVHFDPLTSRIIVDQRFHRLSIFGFTFANAFGSLVPRGEFSYYTGKRFNTANPAAAEGLEEKDFLYYMIGTDYAPSTHLFNVQFIQKVLLDYAEDIYEDQIQNSFSFWWQGKYLNETLKPELLMIYDINESAWLIRPRIAYDLSDRFTVAAGFDILSGPVRSFFGQFDTNDRFYTEVKYSF